MRIQGAWVIESPIYADERGNFREWFKNSEFAEIVGRKFEVSQANVSQSKRGVVRGIHFSLSDSGQAKWVTCVAGAIWDVVVDIRPDSPTFRLWEGIEISAENGKSVVLSEGLGHAFIALRDNTVAVYALSSDYDPNNEFAIHPLDSELGINWPLEELIISPRDSSAPTFSDFLDLRKN